MGEWLLNKHNYTELKKLNILKNKNIKSMVGVKFYLPFYMPIKDESKLIIKYQKKDFVLIFKQHKTKNYVMDDFSFDSFKTEVEITVLKVNRLSLEMEDIESNIEITLALEFLNHFIKSMKVKYNFGDLRLITRQDLVQLVPVRLYTTPSFKEKHTKTIGIANIHFKNIPLSYTELFGNELTVLADFVAHNNQNPYIDSMYYIKRAHELIDNGDFQFGVLSLETGIEMFMYALMKELLKYNRFTEEEINNKLKAGYKNILNVHLKKIFKKEGYLFSFDYENNEKNLLNSYREKLYNLRNKIVHEGYHCKEGQAMVASEVGINLIKNIVDAINSSELQKYVFKNQPLIS